MPETETAQRPDPCCDCGCDHDHPDIGVLGGAYCVMCKWCQCTKHPSNDD